MLNKFSSYFAKAKAAGGILGFVLTHWTIALGAILLGVVFWYVLTIQKACTWRKAGEYGANANKSAENREALENERENIKRESNRELEILNEQGSQANANLNKSLSNLNDLNNRNVGNIKSSDLDADADKYANRRKAGGSW